MTKATSKQGSNEKTDVQVLNFMCLIGTYDKKAFEVVSTNLGGPGARWVRKMNARDQKDCIIDGGKKNEKVQQRMAEVILRRKKQGGQGTFSQAIDATKVR